MLTVNMIVDNKRGIDANEGIGWSLYSLLYKQ